MRRLVTTPLSTEGKPKEEVPLPGSGSLEEAKIFTYWTRLEPSETQAIALRAELSALFARYLELSREGKRRSSRIYTSSKKLSSRATSKRTR